MTDATNNDSRPLDAHGHAALLLVEALMHVLIERSVLTVADAKDIVDTARIVTRELEHDTGDATGALSRSSTLLRAIDQTLDAGIRKSGSSLRED